jgi:phenylalanyl-tRNA synthetase beta chain
LYNWIRELVPGLAEAPGPLERLITMKTAECEGVEPACELLARATLARVESVEPIAGTHLVTAGGCRPGGPRTVVCGAPNCRPGMITAWADIGKKAIHGVESDGMLASAAELGINKDHAGIIELAGEPGGTARSLPRRQHHRDR